MTRLTPDDHQWLETKAKSEDRSMTYVIGRLISQAREADQAKENAPEVAASDALVQ
ncbi:hypothetical protein [Castellaniella ginsengisoli]|uniref:CopG family transcriptional regulator n=1 Tax=Castellaniella ginsengisoli TaxID=546114 RepID=A0AB39D7C8_9BURK